MLKDLTNKELKESIDRLNKLLNTAEIKNFNDRDIKRFKAYRDDYRNELDSRIIADYLYS